MSRSRLCDYSDAWWNCKKCWAYSSSTTNSSFRYKQQPVILNDCRAFTKCISENKQYTGR